MKKEIHKGYICSITSWENDGDYYKTIDLNYAKQTIEDIKRLNTFLSTYMISGCNDNFVWKGVTYRCFGNGENNNDKLLQELWNDMNLSVFSENAYNYMFDLVGVTEFTGLRVFESMKVYEIPEDIVFKEIKL